MLSRMRSKMLSKTPNYAYYQRQFFLAAEKGEIAAVKKLYENKAVAIDPNKMASEGITSLYAAAQNNHIEVVKYLSSLPDINVGLKSIATQATALHVAACRGNKDILAALLATPQGRTNKDTKGFNDELTPLHLAVENDDIEMVELLLAASVDKNIKNKRGLTALDQARNNEIILLLDGSDQKMHSCITQRMKLLGFESNLEGICFGFAEVAKLFALSSKKSLRNVHEITWTFCTLHSS